MNDVETLFDDRVRDGEGTIVDRNTKKFRFKERDYGLTENMVVDSALVSGVTWKDKLLGGSGSGSLSGATILNLEFEDGDILRFFINGIPDIDFSDRLKKILVKYMESTIVVKLVWAPSYVQIWTVGFDPSRPFPNRVLAWIRFPGLPGFLYQKKILEEIRSLIGKVVKLDIKWTVVRGGSFPDENRRLKAKISGEILEGSRFGALSSLDMEAQMADMGAPSKGLGNIRFNKMMGQLGHSEEINQGFWGRFTLGRSWGHGQNSVRVEGLSQEGTESQQPTSLTPKCPGPQLVQKYPTAPISLPKDKATSLHENPTFEGWHRVKVNLIANVLDLKRYTIVTFKENLDNNSKSKMGKGLLIAHRNPSSISRGHGVESRKESSHNGKSIIKSICRHGGRFKPTGSSRVSL
ncbi:hypothetical protein Golax_014880 [Gossypium laxum]|uniref:DUF4283 domain-containing protein n=1 Tax=Gossypium laxum TaxID=34288 RepID=A0A7J8ZW41_9ROSI|nr:hypothetical protein [Gossypium laxum]